MEGNGLRLYCMDGWMIVNPSIKNKDISCLIFAFFALTVLYCTAWCKAPMEFGPLVYIVF